jgi:hypothetical protein
MNYNLPPGQSIIDRYSQLLALETPSTPPPNVKQRALRSGHYMKRGKEQYPKFLEDIKALGPNSSHDPTHESHKIEQDALPDFPFYNHLIPTRMTVSNLFYEGSKSR